MSIEKSLTSEQRARREDLLVLLAGYSWLRFHHADGLGKLEPFIGKYHRWTYDDPNKIAQERDLIWKEIVLVIQELMGSPRLISEADLVATRSELSRNDLKALRAHAPVTVTDSPLRAELLERAVASAELVVDYAPRYSTLGYMQRKGCI